MNAASILRHGAKHRSIAAYNRRTKALRVRDWGHVDPAAWRALDINRGFYTSEAYVDMMRNPQTGPWR